MYVVWKKRELRTTCPCEWCNATGVQGRVAFIPSIVASQRVDGAPRQVHVARLSSIRSCCLKNDRVLAAWWRQVEEVLSTLPKAEASHIRNLLRDGLNHRKHLHGRKQHGQNGKSSGQASVPGYLMQPLKLLGLHWPCRMEEIKTAFRARAKQTHPDVGGRAEDFRAVSEAYSALLDAVGSHR